MRHVFLSLLTITLLVTGAACGGTAVADKVSTPLAVSLSATPRAATPAAVAPVSATPAAMTSTAVPPARTPTVTPTPSAPTPPLTPEPIPALAPTPAVPTRLKIPRIGVDAAIEQVELTPDGNMDVPKKWEDVAWYAPGVRPGSAGNAVIDGHLDSYTGPAVFARLRELKPGDDVAVVTESGPELHFTVTEVAAVDAGAAPTARIFGPESAPHLNLITCDGSWNPKRQQYDQRLVVYTTLAGS